MSRCNLVMRPTETAIYAYGKCDAQFSSGEVTVTIKIDQAVGTVKALVVPTSVQPYDLIIGRDFLDQPTIAFQKTSGSLSLWNLPTSAKSMRATRDEEVVAHHTNFIRVENEQTTLVLPVTNDTNNDLHI